MTKMEFFVRKMSRFLIVTKMGSSYTPKKIIVKKLQYQIDKEDIYYLYSYYLPNNHFCVVLKISYRSFCPNIVRVQFHKYVNDCLFKTENEYYVNRGNNVKPTIVDFII